MKIFWKIVTLALVCSFSMQQTALASGPFYSGANQTNQTDSQRSPEEQRELRRQKFTTGRDLLLNQHVPFDPDELLHDGWKEKLKPTLDAMPEMHETYYQTAPMKGVYLADTLYLPENVQLSGHTVILAHYVVFEGKKPVIKGNFDLHFFPTRPVVVLETTLAEALHKKAQFLNVKFGRKAVLPSFALIQDLGQTGKHEITFDVSGLPPEAARHPRPKTQPILLNTSWSGIGAMLLPQQQQPPTQPPPKNCQKDCANSGGAGATGSEGDSPGPAGPGQPDGGPPAANGSCLAGESPRGSPGTEGGAAQAGHDATTGGTGGVGQDGGTINVDIVDGDTNQYTFIANGGTGGTGGHGGIGGRGGNGGAATEGGKGVACPPNCIGGSGGNGGKGGDAGQGGRGGNGGNGGPGGNGGAITGTYSSTGPVPATSVGRGPGGAPGDPGIGGQGGNPGAGGKPGEPATVCGVTGAPGSFLGSGNAAGNGRAGDFGSFGQPGQYGTTNLTPKPATTGGGGGTDPNEPQCVLGSTFNPDPTAPCSPIIIDTEGEGFHLTSATRGVMFDIAGDGHPLRISWTATGFHNAWLALPGADGLVHNGKELFGNFTPQPASKNPNGFLALAEFDKPEHGGNGDGVIDEHDTVYSRLRLWIDENHDGICQREELHTLPELGVYVLSLTYQKSRRTDDFGNQFRFKSRVNPGGRRDQRDEASEVGRWTYDVFLTTTTK